MSWGPVRVFPPGRTRHIHALQEDPFTGWVWICAGDANRHSFVAYSQDEGSSFHEIGGDGQLWRVCRLLFTEGHVYWGADTNLPEDRCIVRWSRQAAQVEKLAQVGGPVLGATRLAGGTWVFATDREGTCGQQWFFEPDQRGRATEWDDIPSLWISPDGQAWKRLKLSPWLPEARPAFGLPQIAVGSGADRLAVTCLNMARYDNHLMLFHEQQLRRWFEQASAEASDAR